MSFLVPLFFAGAAVVGLPLYLHLARRRPRREVPFSTLMFLRPGEPRFDRRRKLEQKLLLALRCLAVLMIAGAFARPYLARPRPPSAAEPGRRIVVLVDTSASMRRAGLWDEAVRRASAVAERAAAADRVAIVVFDRRARTVVRMDEWAGIAPADRAGTARERIAALAPTWAATDLGRALVAAADALLDDESAGARSGVAAGARQVVLVSDVQEGSRLETLDAAEWPEGTELIVEAVHASGTNAAPQWVPEAAGVARGDAPLRVRVASAAGGTSDRFQLRWDDGPTVDAVVPPGATRVIEVPARPAGGALRLTGDDHDFDDHLFVAPATAVRTRVLYVGADDGERPQDALYFLRRAFPRTRLRETEVVARKPGDPALGADAAAAHMVVVTSPLSAAAAAALRPALDAGRTVLLALDGAAMAETIAALAGATPSIGEGKGEAVLAQIDFAHPALAPFADPRFGDFTKIRFWRHRRLDVTGLRGAQVLARFDDGDPAWLSVPAGKGSLFVMTSGWQPADSQLALSSKFVPLVQALLEASGGLEAGQTQVSVGDTVRLPAARAALTVRKPDGTRVALPADARVFTDTETPGLYVIEGADAARSFAVNLAPSESATAPLPPERLDALHARARVAPARAAAARSAATSAAWNASVESQQKLWRKVLAAALIVLLIESALAARLSRRSPA
jgi:hypothetical protein